MRKVIPIALISIGLLSGCATYGPDALFYTSGKLGEYAHGERGDKTGKACMTSVLGFFAFGDASITKAAQEGSVIQVATIDHEFKNVMGLYGKYCTTVTGR